jgi:hypothetical protein
LILNEIEINEKIIQLYLEDKTVREIAKIVHKSFSYICDVIRKYSERQAKKNLKGYSINSDETKAIQLFSEGKTPTEVKIKLDMATEEVERLYKDYWKLLGLYQLYYFYENEIKKDLLSFLKLYKRIRELGISNEVIIQALRYINELPLIILAVRKKRKELNYLIDKIDALNSKIANLEKSKMSAEHLLEDLQDEIKRQSSIVGRNQEIEKLEYYTKRPGHGYESENNYV